MTYRPEALASLGKSLTASLLLAGFLAGFLASAAPALAEKPDLRPRLHVSDLVDLHAGTRLVNASEGHTQLQDLSYASKIMTLQTELEQAFASQIAVEQENRMLREMLLNLSNQLEALQTVQGTEVLGQNGAF